MELQPGRPAFLDCAGWPPSAPHPPAVTADPGPKGSAGLEPEENKVHCNYS